MGGGRLDRRRRLVAPLTRRTLFFLTARICLAMNPPVEQPLVMEPGQCYHVLESFASIFFHMPAKKAPKVVTIKQGCMLKATPQEVYGAWITSAQHAKFTGQEALVSQKVGGSFTTFDGWATGKNVELVPGQKIVQTWRGDDWPAGHYSTLTLRLIKAPKGTKVLFMQTDVPASKAKSIAQGWQDYYWSAMKSTFGW